MKHFEIVFSGRRMPPSKIVKADRYEIRPANGITSTDDEIVFINDEYDSDVTRESVYDVKRITEIQP